MRKSQWGEKQAMEKTIGMPKPGEAGPPAGHSAVLFPFFFSNLVAHPVGRSDFPGHLPPLHLTEETYK